MLYGQRFLNMTTTIFHGISFSSRKKQGCVFFRTCHRIVMALATESSSPLTQLLLQVFENRSIDFLLAQNELFMNQKFRIQRVYDLMSCKRQLCRLSTSFIQLFMVFYTLPLVTDQSKCYCGAKLI